MKSKFFKDTQELDNACEACTPDKLNVCLRMGREAYERAVSEAARLQISSGEYIERCLMRETGCEPKKWLH